MAAACKRAVDEEIAGMAFGDLFLEDVRKYREARLAGTGLEPLFPLWLMDTRDLLVEMLAAGLKARIVCLDPAKLSAEFAGRDLGDALPMLPSGVDPCGENGEFHSFVYDGPMFDGPIAIENGEVVTRDGFVYADVVPSGREAALLPEV
jgi:diphthamide synthase (EF-2-diphthine--ammonia ligase)